MRDDKPADAEACPVARSLNVIGDRWSLLIVRDAFDGMRRFSDFQRNLGMARNVLADRLRRLVKAGILDMQPASDGSAYQEYVLTPGAKNSSPWWWRCGNGLKATFSHRGSRTRIWSSGHRASRFRAWCRARTMAVR